MAHGRASSILAFGTINNKAVSRLYKAICGFLAFRGSWLRLSLISIVLYCFFKNCDQKTRSLSENSNFVQNNEEFGQVSEARDSERALVPVDWVFLDRLLGKTRCFLQGCVGGNSGTVKSRKRKKGTIYCAEIRIKGHPSLSQTFERKSEAHRWAEETEAALRNNGYVGNSLPD